jgi:hypothetical protein
MEANAEYPYIILIILILVCIKSEQGRIGQAGYQEFPGGPLVLMRLFVLIFFLGLSV